MPKSATSKRPRAAACTRKENTRKEKPKALRTRMLRRVFCAPNPPPPARHARASSPGRNRLTGAPPQAANNGVPPREGLRNCACCPNGGDVDSCARLRAWNFTQEGRLKKNGGRFFLKHPIFRQAAGPDGDFSSKKFEKPPNRPQPPLLSSGFGGFRRFVKVFE